MNLTDPATGQGMEVNGEGQGQVFSVTETVDRHQVRGFSKGWTVPFDSIDPTGADDYFFYFKNTGDKLYAVPEIFVESTVAGTVEVHHVSGTASATNAITAVNRFLGASRAITATVGTNVDITGLTNEGVIGYQACGVAGVQYKLSMSSDFFIPPGEAFAFLWDTSTGVLTGSVSITEVDDERE